MSIKYNGNDEEGYYQDQLENVERVLSSDYKAIRSRHPMWVFESKDGSPLPDCLQGQFTSIGEMRKALDLLEANGRND